MKPMHFKVTPLLCKDCKYCDLGKNSTPPLNWPNCPAQHYWCVGVPSTPDLVTGAPTVLTSVPCYLRRQDSTSCGPAGLFFEAR